MTAETGTWEWEPIKFLNDYGDVLEWSGRGPRGRIIVGTVEKVVISQYERDIERLRIEVQANAQMLREVLEEMCKLQGLPLESSFDPQQPARNYELMERLGLPEWLVMGKQRPAEGSHSDSPGGDS